MLGIDKPSLSAGSLDMLGEFSAQAASFARSLEFYCVKLTTTETGIRNGLGTSSWDLGRQSSSGEAPSVMFVSCCGLLVT